MFDTILNIGTHMYPTAFTVTILLWQAYELRSLGTLSNLNLTRTWSVLTTDVIERLLARDSCTTKLSSRVSLALQSLRHMVMVSDKSRQSDTGNSNEYVEKSRKR